MSAVVVARCSETQTSSLRTARPSAKHLNREGADMGLECGASILGDCGRGKSGEHYITDGIFDDESVIVFWISVVSR